MTKAKAKTEAKKKAGGASSPRPITTESVYNSFLAKAEKYTHLCEMKGEKCIKGINNCCFRDGVSLACDHLGPKGCKIITLKCKLFFCGVVKSKYPKEAEELRALNDEADKKLPGLLFFQSKEEYLKGK